METKLHSPRVTLKTSPAPGRVAVIGGGITGLSAAWHLQRAGLRPIVLERADRVGGFLQSHRDGAWLHELGPNSILENSGIVSALIEGCGLEGRKRLVSAAASHRYIVHDGALVALPGTPAQFLASPLFSAGSKLRLLAEPWRRRGQPADDESVASFVLRRLGSEFLDYAVNPFVGGVYAGNPRQLSVRHAFPKLRELEQEDGSLLEGAVRRRNPAGAPRGRMTSFPDGVEELPRAIARQLPDVRLRQDIVAIRRETRGWTIDLRRGDDRERLEVDAVVAAVGADALSQLPLENIPAASWLACLESIAQPPIASVFLGFRREIVGHPLDGFGLLVPEVEQGRILGALFSSTLFAGRAPDGHVALTAFVGGTRQPELAGLRDSALLDIVRSELDRLLGLRGSPVFCNLQRWPRSIPQYEVGHDRFMGAIAAVEQSAPGLFIGGNSRDGIAIGKCIESGSRLAAFAAAWCADPARR